VARAIMRKFYLHGHMVVGHWGSFISTFITELILTTSLCVHEMLISLPLKQNSTQTQFVWLTRFYPVYKLLFVSIKIIKTQKKFM
jgi:hypothetical protein